MSNQITVLIPHFPILERSRDAVFEIQEMYEGENPILGKCRPQVRFSLLYFRFLISFRINVKLGGINVITDPSQVAVLSDPHNPTVVMGADVMHPA
jgi:hypothetical protein